MSNRTSGKNDARGVRAGLAGLLVGALAFGAAAAATATVEMQKEAKKLGFPVKNCLYCHATPHAAEVMKQRAKALNMADGNCLLCHGDDIPATLNRRGEWLVEEQERRKAKRAEMYWLSDYAEPKDDETEKKETEPKGKPEKP